MSGRRAAVTVRSDAQSRALSTLWQGIGVDALVLIGLGLTELMAMGDPTSGAFWLTIGILVVKSFLTALASFLVRLKFPAETATT